MFVTVGDAQIFTISFGSRALPPIVGIGGWIGSWELWADPFSILSQDWHTIAYDHRGSGATVAPPASITFARLVDDLFAVLDALGVEQCVLAAESSGALTALLPHCASRSASAAWSSSTALFLATHRRKRIPS